MGNVAILLLNYNGRAWIFDCISSIKKSTYKTYDIVVIDNASTDGSVQILESEFPDVKLIKNYSNLGYCRGFNAGLRYAQSKSYDYALIMNNDSIIEPSTISFLIETSKKYNDSLVTGKVLDYESGLIQTVGKFPDPNSIVGGNIGFNEVDNGQYDRISKLDFCDDVILIYPLKHSKELGFYDEIFFLYYEELDFQINAKKAGIGIYYDHRAVIRHKGSLSSGGGTNKINSFYLSRNKILFLYLSMEIHVRN